MKNCCATRNSVPEACITFEQRYEWANSMRDGGFTLIELMITVAIVAVLATVAMPSYSEYVIRSKIPEALESLSAYRVRMEQAYQDNGNYGSADVCAVVVPVTGNFDFVCELQAGGQSFTAMANGKATGRMAGFTFTVDANNTKRTEAYPGAVGLPQTCWMTSRSGC